MSQWRNRPFLVVSYKYVLAPGQKSHGKGFGETAEWEPVESMVIVDSISKRHLMDAEIILDLLRGQVLKNRDASLDPRALFSAIVTKYREEVKVSLARWMAQNPNNAQEVQALADHFKAPQENEDQANE